MPNNILKNVKYYTNFYYKLFDIYFKKYYNFCMRYYKYKIENLIKVNKIVTVHNFYFDKNFKSLTEHHDFKELIYVESGSIFCVQGSEAYYLKQGDMFFYKTNEEHFLFTDENINAKIIIISFESKSEPLRFLESKSFSLDDSSKRVLDSIIKEAKTTFDVTKSNQATKKMQLLPSPTLGGLQLIKNYLEVLLVQILRGENEKAGNNKTFIIVDNQHTLSNKIDNYLKENLQSTLKIKDIAEFLNYSPSYLYKTYKKQKGKTIMDTFMELKTEKAKELLQNTNLSVTLIAETLNYDCQSYFTKSFKKHAGITPTAFRKKYGVK